MMVEADLGLKENPLEIIWGRKYMVPVLATEMLFDMMKKSSVVWGLHPFHLF